MRDDEKVAEAERRRAGGGERGGSKSETDLDLSMLKGFCGKRTSV